MSNIRMFFQIFTVAVIIMGAVITGCRSQQPTTQPRSSSPFGVTSKPPCTVFDDEINFAATGFANGPRSQLGVLQRTALANAQDMIRAKMEHAYEGFIDTYMGSVGANQGTDVETETRGVGRQTIMQVVGNTSHSCLEFSNVDEKGNVDCFIAITIPKAKISQAIADNLSKSQKEEIRNRAADMRKEADEYFKNLRNE